MLVISGCLSTLRLFDRYMPLLSLSDLFAFLEVPVFGLDQEVTDNHK